MRERTLRVSYNNNETTIVNNMVIKDRITLELNYSVHNDTLLSIWLLQECVDMFSILWYMVETHTCIHFYIPFITSLGK